MLQIYNWNPDYYDNPDELPSDMPADVKDYIAKNTTSLEVGNTVFSRHQVFGIS